MPELPEIETIKLYLKQHILGKKVTGVKILEKKQFHGDPNTAFGLTVKDISRKGKILDLQLTTNNVQLHMSFHLKLSGQILYAPDSTKPTFKNVIPRADSNTMPAKTTRVILVFDDNSALYFNDMRKFGWVKLGPNPEGPTGVDVLDQLFTAEYLKETLNGIRRPIKVVLLDQEKMAGIGNIYANDSLWEAKIHPARKANTLTDEEIHRLHTAILKIIHEGIQYKGSSAQDELYLVPDSTKGQYQHHFKTYHKHGTPCTRCRTKIERIVVGGRGTFFCPTCQQ